jgi:hypothetical protein
VALARAKWLVRDGLRRPLRDGLALETEAIVEHLGGAGAADGISRVRRPGPRPGTKGVIVTEKLIGGGLALLDLDADGVGHLRLNRPEASNGMDVAFLRALHEAILAAHGEPRLRVLLLSGEGPNFCAGGDVKTFASKRADLPDYLRQATSWLQACVQGLAAVIERRAPVFRGR